MNKVNFIRYTILVAILGVTITSASSESIIASFSGNGTLDVGGTIVNIKNISNMIVQKTGRVNFNIPTGFGAIAISGGKDIQISPEKYILKVDSILNSVSNIKTERLEAQGKCEMTVSTDGKYVRSLTCHVTSNDFGKISLKFKGNKIPVKILRVPDEP